MVRFTQSAQFYNGAGTLRDAARSYLQETDISERDQTVYKPEVYLSHAYLQNAIGMVAKLTCSIGGRMF